MLKNEYGFQDFTQLMELVERTENIWETMGLLDNTEYMYWNSTGGKFRRVEDGEDEILAQARGGDRNFAGRENAKEEYFETAFFPLDGIVTAQDVQDLIQLDSEGGETPESVANRVRRLIARIQRSHAKLLQRAMYYAVKENKTYVAGMPTKEVDFSTKWGLARKSVVAANFDLTDPAIDPFETLEVEGRRHIIAEAGDNADGYQIAFACSSQVFDKLIAHPKFEGAYSQYQSTQEPLRRRLLGDRNNRAFEHKGIIVIEMIEPAAKGGFANDMGYLFPLGLPMFNIAFAPADTLEHANTTALPAYLFMETDARKQTVQSESSFVIVNTRPDLVVSFQAKLA